MTEAEARTKWCPMVRIVAGPGQAGGPGYPFAPAAGVNRDVNGVPLCRCLASGCMMWRWVIEGQQGRCGLTSYNG